MKITKTLIALAALLACGSAFAATPKLTITPAAALPGSTVTLSLDVLGNVTPGVVMPVTLLFASQLTWYESDDPLTLVTGPVVNLEYITGGSGASGTAAYLKNPTWTLSLPTSWTWLTEPVSTGGQGFTSMRTPAGIQAVVTMLKPDTLWRTTWQMTLPKG